MVEIYSPSGKEKNISEYIFEQLTKLGFKVTIDSVNNVIGEIGEGSLNILLCGHMDTVSPELPVKIENDILYGRGAVDAKSPLAAFIVAASELSKEKINAKIIVAGVVDEEGKSIGIKELNKKKLKIDYAVFGEPTAVDTITVGYKGSISMKVTLETETGHSSSPWLYSNSIEKAIELWELIKQIKTEKNIENNYFNSITACLIKIEGGQNNNIVPNKCTILIDARIPPHIKCSEYKLMVEKIVNEFKKLNDDTNIKLEFRDETEAYLAPIKSPIVKAFTHSIWNNRKKQVKLTYKTGTGDMNFFGSATGIPCITYGPGNSHYDHTNKEQIEISEYLSSILVIKEAIKRLCITKNI
ncbi:M20/M25/M40 family metallo-hydrolase [Candidatus Bathyarchaeota archaeon]|nr:M20/M25/M40 family metallo-hydrolase [Candidatus Bathyarchaeota archaeon]